MKGNFVRRIYREKDVAAIQQKISLLGNTKLTAETFLNNRFFSSLLVFLGILYTTKMGYVYAPIATILFYYLYYYVVIEIPIKKRILKLDHEALYFFEILTLTLESGRNLDNALDITVFNVHSELSEEFKKALFEVKFGKSLMEALEDMKKRIPSETINNIILNMIQTSVFGNNIIDTMYHQIDFLRGKQILEIKGQINKIPNRVSIVSVLFVVPLILLLVLGPFIVQFLTQ